MGRKAISESTLSLTRSQLEAEVGFSLGWGRGDDYSDTAWDTRKQQGIDAAIDAGLRMFYYPTPMPGDKESYDWSFMRPTRTVTLVSGQSLVALPDDFGGLEGDVHFVESGRTGRALKQTSEQLIGRMFMETPDRTGQPEVCAIKQEVTTGKYKGQRASLYVFPTADDDYTLSVQYYILPDTLTTSFPYALGGAQHAETIKAACLAAADLHQNDRKAQKWDLFIDRMRASISLDRRNKAQFFGLNLDQRYHSRRLDWRNDNMPVITYDGTEPT